MTWIAEIKIECDKIGFLLHLPIRGECQRDVTKEFRGRKKYNLVVFYGMSQTFTSKEVIRITEVTQRCLDYWNEIGLVIPSGKKRRVGSRKRGRGDGRLYAFQDLLKLKVVKQLRENGLSLQKIQSALTALTKRKPSSEPFNHVLVSDGKQFLMKSSDGKVEDLLGGGQLLITAFAITSLEKELEKKIVKLKKAKKLASA